MKKILPTFFFLTLISLSFFAGRALAVKPVPDARTPCRADQSENPNFNSTRPYQASPCGDSDKAVMCGNTVQFFEDTPSRTAPAGTKSLAVDITMPAKTYAVDLSGAEFPIAGNTEQTKNSQSTADSLDDATKMNEYLNWYLSGVNGKAEYGQDSQSKTVDYSGPVKKLLPSIIQDAQRFDVIKSISKNITYNFDHPNNPDQENGPEMTITEPSNHNQIVVCAKNANLDVPWWMTIILNFLQTQQKIPTECYPSAKSKAAGDMVLRLNDWNGSSVMQDIINSAGSSLSKLFPGNEILKFVTNTTTRWPKNYPPLPWSDENGKPFTTDIAYQKAYNEWRGDLCAVILGHLVCLNASPIVSNPYADLYQYVPLSNTVDHSAKNLITSVQIKGEAGTEIVKPKIVYNVVSEPVLMYPHTQEVADLSNSLNKTYIPKTGTNDKPISATTEPVNDPATGICRTVNIRSNPGDNLFAEVTSPGIKVQTYEYRIKTIPCHDVTDHHRPTPTEIQNGAPDVVSTYTYASCKGQVSISIPMLTKVPEADLIYNSTTAGADSTFRKIYPKVEPGAPVSCISNDPSVTNVKYTPTQGASDKTNFKVLAPDGTDSTDNPQLFFPHFGSVYDYFLKGIQTALRPKGFGEPTPVSGLQCQNSSQNFADICAVADAYKIPCCQLKGVAEIETGSGTTTGSDACKTKNGTYRCCNGDVCGPSQVACGQYDDFAGNDKINMCDSVGSAELLARAMLLKRCQADKICDSYDWKKWGNIVTKRYNIVNDCKNPDLSPEAPGNMCYTATGYFYGLNNGCTVNACTEFRWGPGKTYCDSVKSYCETNHILPDNPHPEFCSACNQDLVRAGQTPMSCSGGAQPPPRGQNVPQ